MPVFSVRKYVSNFTLVDGQFVLLGGLGEVPSQPIRELAQEGAPELVPKLPKDIDKPGGTIFFLIQASIVD